ncbi:hypothetical protein GCM10022254_56640 [Actinomadura meridiana]|uniref:Uncharacterized protein n=1 Tax=Actinomadura meridiana TaxID=559626 RepID=A0ABP8CGD6_9ACTN
MTPDAMPALYALGSVLRAHGYTAETTSEGLRVSRDDGLAEVITVNPREDDGGRLWFFTVRQAPLAEAARITDALMAVKSRLNGGG